MTEGVVYRLEPIQIDHQQRERTAISPQLAAFAFEHLGECMAVGQFGQGVVHGDMLELIP